MSKSDIKAILSDFYLVSGMDISVVDRDFHTLSLTRSPKATLCTAIHRNPKSIDICKSSDIERLTFAKKSSQPILYTCPFGITEAIVPIIKNDEPIGYIISALGIKKGNESAVYELCSSCQCDHQDISVYIDQARKLTDEEMIAYFNMMKMLAQYVSSDDSLTDKDQTIAQLIRQYIKNNLSQKLTLKDIARHLHCSTVTLTEHFKREFGITINEYISLKRMQAAERLLLTTDRPLRDVAAMVGFSDVEYFSRTFKKHHNESPATWRRKNKGEKNDRQTYAQNGY